MLQQRRNMEEIVEDNFLNNLVQCFAVESFDLAISQFAKFRAIWMVPTTIVGILYTIQLGKRCQRSKIKKFENLQTSNWLVKGLLMRMQTFDRAFDCQADDAGDDWR